MEFNFECCDLAATAPGTCDECIQSGRHETAGRVAPRFVTVHPLAYGFGGFSTGFGASSVPSVEYEVTTTTSDVRTFDVEVTERPSLLDWLMAAHPTGIQNPLFRKL